jgi:two-component system sporulation sensor kinase A
LEDLKPEYDQNNSELLIEIERLKIENEKLQSQLVASKEISKHHTKSEKKFEQLFNNISDAVYYLKIDDEGIAGNFIEANEVAYNRLGYTRKEILEMSPSHIDFHEEEELVNILKLINNNESIIFETIQYL